MASSIRKHEPGVETIALLVDEVSCSAGETAFREMSQYFDRIIFAHELGIPDFNCWMFKHNVVEACTAVKPRLLEILLRENESPVMYMDPDTFVFAPFINELLGTYSQSILLTPHQLEANQDERAIRDNELGSTKYGVFNLGFAGVRATGAGKEFASWWRSSCELFCYEDVAEGIFTDQKWCDLVPALFADFAVIRDPGMNVASWNLSRRKLSFDNGGEPLVNGTPLKFFHFTKVGSVGETMIERYAESNVEAYEILRLYTNKLQDLQEAFPKVKWKYGYFTNDDPVSDTHRQTFRQRTDLMNSYPSPFASGDESYQQWFTHNSKA